MSESVQVVEQNNSASTPAESVANPPQNARRSLLAPRRAYKPRTTVKSPAVQASVLTRRAMGHSKAKIARELGIAVNTVTSIAQLNDFDREIMEGRIGCVKLIPAAIQVASDRLAKGSENMAIKVLENSIWPLNAKTSKQGDPGLVLAIQNLMGNVTLNQPAEAAPTTSNSVPGGNLSVIGVESSQVIDNKASGG